MYTLPPDILNWERHNARATQYAVGAALLSLTIIYSAAWVVLRSTL